MTLLSINIPTYERLNSFSSVITELAAEVGSLSRDQKELIAIKVYDNDSTCHALKRALCQELSEEFCIHIDFKKNYYNVGGELNIHQCYLASPHATFTWVLGDDDHVASGSLNYVVKTLRNHKDNLGLLILSDQNYDGNLFKSENDVFDSYYEFALIAIKVQPHILISHTLISANIVRSAAFVDSESLYAMKTLYSRYGHWIGYSHMRGMLFGLMRSNYKVIFGNQIVLDTTRTEHRKYYGVQIFDAYYFHFLWLLTEIGVRIDQIKLNKSMLWLSRGIRFKLMIFWFKLQYKERLRHLLIRMLGDDLFRKLRSRIRAKNR